MEAYTACCAGFVFQRHLNRKGFRSKTLNDPYDMLKNFKERYCLGVFRIANQYHFRIQIDMSGQKFVMILIPVPKKLNDKGEI